MPMSPVDMQLQWIVGTQKMGVQTPWTPQITLWNVTPIYITWYMFQSVQLERDIFLKNV